MLVTAFAVTVPYKPGAPALVLRIISILTMLMLEVGWACFSINTISIHFHFPRDHQWHCNQETRYCKTCIPLLDRASGVPHTYLSFYACKIFTTGGVNGFTIDPWHNFSYPIISRVSCSNKEWCDMTKLSLNRKERGKNPMGWSPPQISHGQTKPASSKWKFEGCWKE